MKRRVGLEHMVVGVLVVVTLVAGAFLSTSRVSADEVKVTKNASVTVPDACTMTGSEMNSHTAEVANGTYESEIGSTTLKITCNNGSGFAVYAIGFTGDAYEGEDHTKLIGVNSNQKIVTGTATSAGNPDTSNWAMKVGTDSSATYPLTLDNSFGSYHAVPSTYTRVAYRNSGTDIGASATGSELTTTYAAYISRTQSADTYNGKVKYTLVHPATGIPPQPVACTAGKICYNANGGNVVGTMGQQSVGDGSTVTLLASNFSREGYGFVGWNDKFDYSGNFYGPQEDISIPSNFNTKGLALYAVWVKSVGKLQSDAVSVCANLTQAPATGGATLASVSALTDQRDNQTYAIAKLADGNCWMIENLRLESTNSDNSTGALAQGYGASATYGNFSGLADAESTGFSSTYTVNSLYYSNTQEGTASVDIGTTNNPAYRMPRYNNTNTSARATNPTNNKKAMYSYGNYYTWAAAIADTSHYSSDGHSTTSICPAGWKIPAGNTSGEYYALNTATNSGATDTAASKKLRSYPNNFLYSGYFNASSAYDWGDGGHYWTSTAGNYYNSYYFYLYSTLVSPGGFISYKYNGISVRCIASST